MSGPTTSPAIELFHAIGDLDSAAARRAIVERGIEARIRFRNLFYQEVAADFRARGGVRIPALWDGARLFQGLEAVLAGLERIADDDRRFVNNPFSRALHPAPDDEKASSPFMYLVFGLLSLILVALFVAALVLPPLFTETLIVRGLRTGRPAMLALGLFMAALYFLAIVSIGKRLMSRPKRPDPD